MRCLYCGADTRIVKSRPISGGYGISRTRECEGAEKHTFNTKESGPPGHDLRKTAIRRSGSKELGDSLFDADRLFRDVKIGVLGRLPDSSLQEAVDDVIAALQRADDFQHDFSEEERTKFETATGWLWDTQIAEGVERQLVQLDRMAVVLYALSTRGRRDRKGRTGWADVHGALHWLKEQYPYLELTSPPVTPKTDTQKWAHPGTPAPRPQWLIKRSHGDDVRAHQQRFDLEQFKRSIRHALVGRFDEDERDTKVGLIAEWVLWGLAGQDVVLSSQLADAVLDCFRRIDDIAYLRWTAIMKGIKSVTEFAREAEGLVNYPSPRLELSGDVRRGRDATPPPAPIRG